MILNLFGKGVGQAGESAVSHPQRQVAALHKGRGDVAGGGRAGDAGQPCSHAAKDRPRVIGGVIAILEEEDFFGTEFAGDSWNDKDDEPEAG